MLSFELSADWYEADFDKARHHISTASKCPMGYLFRLNILNSQLVICIKAMYRKGGGGDGELLEIIVSVLFRTKLDLYEVSRCGLAIRRLAGKQKDLGSIRFGSPFSSLQKLWFMDTVLWLCLHN